MKPPAYSTYATPLASKATNVGAAWSVETLLRRSNDAFQRMASMLRLYQAIAEMFYPERADFTGRVTPGDERYWDIFDEEAMLLRRNLANQIGAMIRPRGQDWFKCVAFPRNLNDNDDVRVWCEYSTKVTREVLYTSTTNFTRAMNESDNDYVAFGASVLKHSYNHDRSGLIFECLHLRDCAWYRNTDLTVDEFYEKRKWSLQTIADMGMAIPRDLEKVYKENPHTEIDVIVCVYPVARYNGDKPLPRRARYVTSYIAVGCKEELKARNGQTPYFRTFPYWVREWSRVSGEPSGRSPCTSVALATARTLNQAGLSIIESLEKLVNPPLIAPDDGVVGEVQIRANGITYYDPEVETGSRPPIDALPVGRPDFGMQYAEERRQFLARAFLQNIINFPGVAKEMTAYEAQRLWEQYMRDAAPVFEPLEQDNGILMEAVFERIFDADGPGKSGGYPPPPDELLGAEVKFEFKTPLSAAYDRLEFEKAQEAATYIANRAQINPGVADLIDQDAMDRAALKAIVPAEWVRNKRDVVKARAQKQEQQQQALAANMALAAAHGQTGASGAPPTVPNPDPIQAALNQ